MQKCFYLIIFVTTISCGNIGKSILKGKPVYDKVLHTVIYNDSISYTINYKGDCCGCTANFINVLVHKKITTQYVYNYTCFGAGVLTKYNINGKAFLAFGSITNNKKSVSLSPIEKHIFATLHNLYPLGYNTKSNYKIVQTI
jgi:hypothetical protein